MSGEYAPPSAGARYGLRTDGPATPATSELNTATTPSPAAVAEGQPWNPASPLFWLGAIAAVTFGLMAVSTSVRVGPARVSVSAGKG